MAQVQAHDREGTDLPELHRLLHNPSFVIWDSRHHYTWASAWDENGLFIRGAGWIDPQAMKRNLTEPLPPPLQLEGNYVGFTMWFEGNFGHYLDDHLPSIAYLRTQVPTDTKFLLLDTPLARSTFQLLDEGFYRRIVWIQEQQPVQVSGSLHVSVVHPGYPLMWGCQRPYDYLRHWIRQQLPRVPARRRVVFYSRGGQDTIHGRVLDPEQQQIVVAKIQQAMIDYQRPEQELVIFSGMDAQGNTLAQQEQYALFRSAKTIIGPHGAGILGNLIWVDPVPPTCHDRVQLLEFIPGADSTQVQPMYHSLHMRWRRWPVDFHAILYTRDSTPQVTRIDLGDFDTALHAMWARESAVTHF